uniref:Pectinesterase inhibitor 10-like n=1 Tax=Cicer arietinum TaxID=3827 RepID=A0A1S3E4P8_CICAR|nr:pectinesterase inhibitor 10-like [Cicer arietinum]
MKIQNDDRPASKKRKARPSSSLFQKSEAEITQPPPEDTPSPLIPKPTSPLRNSPNATLSPNSPVPTPTQSSPIHKLTPLHEADPLPADTFTSTPLQNMEDGEELYFDLNLSYPPSPTDVPMASPPTLTVDEDPKDSVPSTRVKDNKNQKQMKLLKLIRKDQKKIIHRFTHFHNFLVQFGLILEWVTKHLVPTITPGDHPPELPAQPSSDVPSPSSSSDEPSSSD